jgi:phosphatidate cytidylyltransferase
MMLKQRLITAAVLIPLVVLTILKLPTNVLQWCLAGVTLLAAWEWFFIVGIHSVLQRSISFIGLIAAAVCASMYINPDIIVLVGAVVWLLATILVFRFAHISLSTSVARIFADKYFGFFVAIMVLVAFWFSSIFLHQSSSLGPQQLLYVMVTVWLADSGGYFAGKRWGKQPLAKVISPNKTWQGVYGALVLVGIGALVAYMLGINGQLSLITWLVLTMITAIFSIVGDLFESLFKRSHQVKDSGNLLPGHGGILDRIDSLLAAVPIFVTGLIVLGTV